MSQIRQRRKPSAARRSSDARSSSNLSQSSHVSRPQWLSHVRQIIGIRPRRPNALWRPGEARALCTDLAIAGFILLVTLVTRFYKLEHPPRIVFDEFHFAKFVDQYVKGEYLFDIHPPLGKLTMVAAAKLGGYQALNYAFESIGKPYGDVVFYPQRALAATFGSFIPPLLYLTCRKLGISIIASVTAATMAVTDMMLCIESRLILTDSQLIFFIQSSLFSALHLWSTPKSTPRRFFWLIMTALSGTCAISTKWTALVAPAMIAIVSATGAVFPEEGMLDLLEMVVAAVTAGSFYVMTFALHFWLLPISGPGNAFMRPNFVRTLVNSSIYEPGATDAPTFLQSFWYLNWEMLRANRAIETRHSWESKWYEWMYNARGVLYLDETMPEGVERIYLIMNPVVCLVALAGMVFCLGALLATPLLLQLCRFEKAAGNSTAASRKSLQIQHRAGIMAFFLFCYIVNLLPYIGITRCTFIYHMLPSLQMATILTAIALDQLPAKRNVRLLFCVLLITAMCAAFAYWSPWVYALPMPRAEHKKLEWMPRWN